MKEILKKFIPPFLLNLYYFILAFLGALIYSFPSRKIKVIGVTGTNGKSTVVEMVSKILGEAGYKVASISSIKFKIGDKEWLNTLKMTMPGRFKIQKFLRQAAEANCQYLVLEVTSEGIKQHRHQFIDFAVAVFTNLTPEHIEAHGGFERYREAKGKLFKATKDIHIINLDDENAEYFLRFPAHKKIGFTLNEMSGEPFSAIKARNIQVLQSGLKFFVDDTEFNLKLLGEFNIYNALAAICVGLSQGISLETCKKALEKIEGIPGRMEEVIPKPFKVFVDYAFTPNALEKVYQTIKNNFKPKKLICVLGATGGGRDKWKRPILGKLTREYCDEVIVTNEDPYNEDPMEIINQVADGTGEKAKKILDRRKAISEALKIAKEGDVIIITGKGCEPWICVTDGKKIPWDDRQVVKEEFRKIYEKV
jgi:UDP-N-acetylmuramoyl-L-alanyl-D-glutamate--2,6-diaminopimelate ligase